MRGLLVVALCGCAPSSPSSSSSSDTPPAPPRHWALAPAPSVWPLGSVHGRIGRGVAAQPVTALGIVGDGAPIVDPTVWDAGSTLAVVSGTVEGKPTVEVYDIDAGTRLWRASCGAPVVGVTPQIIVCGDANGVHSLDPHGKPGWSTTSPFVAIDGVRVIVGNGSVVDAATGTEQFAVALPVGARAMAACDGELFAVLADRRLARFTTKLAWAVALAKTDELVSVDACDPTTPILVTVAGEHGTALVAIGRDGKLLGRIDDVRGTWPARDDEHAIEVATRTAVTRWDRALAVGQPLDLPVLGAAIAKRGERRLVRATPATAALIDRRGIRAYVALGESSAALGNDHVLAGLRWFGLPRPWTHVLRTTQARPVMVPAELRDLPPPVTPVLANSPELAFGTKLTGVAIAGGQLYAATDAGIAQLDLATLHWGWHAALAARAIAATTDVVVVATATSIVGFATDGTKRWERPGVGRLELAGDAVLVGSTVLDAATGTSRGEVTSLATVVAFDETALVITAERDRIVARVPSVRMLPAWSVEVAGVVTSLQRAGDGVLVALDNGDAYRIAARTGDAVAVAGIGLGWRVVGDTVTGEAPGGPIPGVIKPPITKPELYKPTDLQVAPAIATPWPPPPPMPASWQLTVYDVGGGLRTRNDYAIAAPVPALRVGPAPFVYVSGHDALVLDPVHGDPLRRVALPEIGLAFSAIVDGRAVVGTILAAPLRAVVF